VRAWQPAEHQWPTWLDRPALSRLTVSSPELLKPFASLNAGKPYPDQVKPFSFLLVGHVRPFEHPGGPGVNGAMASLPIANRRSTLCFGIDRL
jgi:hypothetical protein